MRTTRINEVALTKAAGGLPLGMFKALASPFVRRYGSTLNFLGRWPRFGREFSGLTGRAERALGASGRLSREAADVAERSTGFPGWLAKHQPTFQSKAWQGGLWTAGTGLPIASLVLPNYQAAEAANRARAQTVEQWQRALAEEVPWQRRLQYLFSPSSLAGKSQITLPSEKS